MVRKSMLLLMAVFMVFLWGCTTRTTTTARVTCNPITLSGDGTPVAPYLISKSSDFLALEACPTANYQLTDDIDFSTDAIRYENGLYTFGIEPVTIFAGTLDGNGHLLTYSGDDGDPLFLSLEGAVIKNLRLNWNVDTTLAVEYHWQLDGFHGDFGILAKVSRDSVIQNIVLEGQTNYDISSHKNIPVYALGALVGINESLISNVYVNMDLSYKSLSQYSHYIYHVGGIVGENKGLIQDVRYEGVIDVNADSSENYAYVGGVVGVNKEVVSKASTSVEIDSYSAKNTSGYDGIAVSGGVVGWNTQTGVVSDVISVESKVHAFGCWLTASGGVIGYNNGALTHAISSGNISLTRTLFTFEQLYGFGGIIGQGQSSRVHDSVYFKDLGEETAIFGDVSFVGRNLKIPQSLAFRSMFENEFGFSEELWLMIDGEYPQLILNQEYWVCDDVCTLRLAVVENE
ncbi:MAG: hypothetical protein PHP32_01645 [Candidatus Izemoplasmatales bacterium]|nr:hypothetical protein [Candidatus Izemoplasmatales bacterium]